LINCLLLDPEGVLLGLSIVLSINKDLSYVFLIGCPSVLWEWVKAFSFSTDCFGANFRLTSAFLGGSKKLTDELAIMPCGLGTTELYLLFLVVFIFLVDKPF
jgi:hypothetical protein